MLQSEKFQWLADGVDLPELDYELIQRWLTLVAERHNRIVGNLSYIFCNDPKILEVNRQFLNHDYFTDVITFDDCAGVCFAAICSSRSKPWLPTLWPRARPTTRNSGA